MSMWKSILSLALVLATVTDELYGQNANSILHLSVQDKVSGSPLSGANIKTEVGQNIITDRKGVCSFMLTKDDTYFTVGLLGYKTDTIWVNQLDEKKLNVLLRPVKYAIEEVVINTGYQKVGKERLTGAVYQVDENLLNTMVSTSVIDRLANNVPGLVFNKTGGNPSNQTQISIRGQSTLFSRPDPLIVLDNFPYDGDLSSINPDDIESINILKDAAAASVWGARAANGVIVLTSKKGSRGSGPSITFSAQSTVAGKPDLYYEPRISPADYIGIERQLFDEGFYDTQESASNKPVLTPAVELLIANRDGQLSDTDLEMALDRLGRTDLRTEREQYLYQGLLNQHYALTLNNRGDNRNWLIALGYDNNRDNLVKNGFKRMNGRLLLEQSIWENRIAFSGNIGVNWTDSYAPNTGQLTMSSYTPLYPYARLREENGQNAVVYKDFRHTYLDEVAVNHSDMLDWRYRPLDEVSLWNDHTKNLEYRFDLNIKAKLFEGVDIDAFYQFVNRHTESRNDQSVRSYGVRSLINQFTEVLDDGVLSRPIPLGNILDLDNRVQQTNRLRVQGNILKDLYDDVTLQSILGMEVNATDYDGVQHRFYGHNPDRAGIQAVDYINPIPSFVNPASTNRIPFRDNLTKTADRFMSYYQNTSLTWKSRYLLTASTRLDQSNIFGVSTNQKGVPLWSVGLAWELAKESFLNVPWVSHLKFRTTYGSSGNVNRSLSAYTTAAYTNSAPFSRLPYATIVNPPNAELRWERTKVLNVGTDFTLFDGRLSGTFDFYRKKAVDLIGDSPFPASSGVTRYRGNVAASKGNGFEAFLNAMIINRKLKWNTTMMLSRATDIVTDYMDLPISGFNLIQSTTLNPQRGKPLFSMYGFKSYGLDPQTGDPVGMLAGEQSTDWNAIVQNTTIDDLVYFGTSRPMYTASLRNTWSWKGWSLTTNISYRGKYFYRMNSIRYMNSGVLDKGLASGHADFLNRWKSPGDELRTTIPSIPIASSLNRDNVYLYGETLVERGDHIRWEDLSLSYQFRGVSEIFKTLELFCYANNIGLLWVKTNTNLDPDYSSAGQLPPVRTYSMGLRLGL